MPVRSLFSWILALALLIGQAATFSHALAHVDEHDGGAPDRVCEVCVGHAGLAGTLPAKGFDLLAAPARHVPLPAATAAVAGVCHPRAQARAPPPSV